MSIFTSVRGRKPKRNKFDMSHERKFSLKMGNLVPCYVQDIVPGDKFRVRSEMFMRMAPMIAPIMHRVNVYVHYFFVPNRLVWNQWEDFITGGRLGDADPVPPQMTLKRALGLIEKGSLGDYMGIPTYDEEVASDVTISSLPFRAYQTIFNEYYRDQNLSDPVHVPLTSGLELNTDYNRLLQIRQRAWEKDYFTSALPWAQRGGDVNIPFEGSASPNYRIASDVIGADGLIYGGDLSSENPSSTLLQDVGASKVPVRIENIESIDIDGSTVTVNELRRSIRLQEWLEKNARGGARYVEQILSHFGVRSKDARLQRPEYLGGGKQPVQISEVLQTMQESGGSGNPLGAMGGHGVAVGNSNGFSRFFEEHGYVIGIMSVLPKTAYQQGIPRHFSRNDRFDYYWPEFANIGEQEIKNKEIYFDHNQLEAGLEGTFGYQSRYAEYKFNPSTVHGEFRDTLAFWHMGRIFDSIPSLNENFVTSDPTQRIFAVEDEEHLYCQLYNSVSAIRPMPYFGTPTL